MNCPKCDAPKTTKASQNVRLRCGSCGEWYLAPPVSTDAGDVNHEPPLASSKPKPKPKGSGVRVVRASGVKVKSNSKTRKKDPAPETPKPLPAETAEVVERTKPEHQERSKQAGRRGGLGFYTRRVRRAGK